MAANVTPVFPDTPIAACGKLDTANTALDGSGNVVTIYTPGADGGRIEYLRVKAQATTTAGMIRFFIHDGSNYRLWDELVVSAIVQASSTATFEGEIIPARPLVLPSGYSLRASTEKGEIFLVFAHGGDF